MMRGKNSKIAMNCAGAALAVCSTMAFVGANKGSHNTKKMIKKTADKIVNVIDSVSSFM